MSWLFRFPFFADLLSLGLLWLAGVLGLADLEFGHRQRRSVQFDDVLVDQINNCVLC